MSHPSKSDEYPTVVLTDEELDIIKSGGTIGKTVDGTVLNFGPPTGGPIVDVVIDRPAAKELRNGERLLDNLHDIAVMHIDHAGTPKSTPVAAERIFEMFKEADGEARSVALEALHMLGYRVEREYKLVEKDA